MSLQFTTYISSLEDIKACQNAGLEEVLIGPEQLCRQSRLTPEEVGELARNAHNSGLSPVLVWDILMTEENFEQAVKHFHECIHHYSFSIFRVQDTGALHYLMTSTTGKIQLNVETGNANLIALQRWEQFIGSRLDRLILSLQIPEDRIIRYCKELRTPCELLGAGPILLFYTPRQLLTSKLHQSKLHQSEIEEQDIETNGWLYAISHSQESHHREFPTLQNSHGTFMYLHKDQFILDRLDRLDAAGLAIVRIDMRHICERPHSASNLESLISAYHAGEISADCHWPNPAFAPFHRTNQTTKQFTKLKPQILQNRDETCVARVLASHKPNYMVLQALQDFRPAHHFTLSLPDGKEIPCGELEFTSLDGVPRSECKEDDVLLARWIKRCSPGALLKLSLHDHQSL